MRYLKGINSVYYIILVLGLFGTMTNYIYLSPIPSLIAPVLSIIIIIFNYKKLPKFVFYLGLFFLYNIISTLIYHPRSFLDFSYYRYDANFFISYFPLIIAPFIKKDFNLEKLLVRFLLVVSFSSLIAYLFFSNSGFPGFFLAHNAAGGFFSITLSLSISLFYYRRNWFNLILVFVNVFLLIETFSRGSIMGVVLGFFCVFLWKKRKTRYILFLFMLLLLVQSLILVKTYPIYKQYDFSNSENFYEYIHKKEGVISGRKMNIYLRAYYEWPRGIECFFSSPVLGMGTGVVNDTPYKIKTIVPHLLSVNEQKNKQFNSGHAHHSLFHILGENGLIGTLIFILFYMYMYKYIKVKGVIFPNVQLFLIYAFFNLLIMSFSEHRITTPSNVLPFTIILSLFIIKINATQTT